MTGLCPHAILDPVLFARANRSLGLGLLLAALLGCVRVEQTITLNPDGSGVLAVQYGMALETVADLEARLKADSENGEAPPSLLSFDENQVREDFKELEPQGILLQDIRTWASDGFKYMRLSVRFSSLDALSKTEFLSDRNFVLRRTPENDYELRQTSPPVDPAQAEAQAMMSGLLAGFRAELAVELPGPIIEANADAREGRRAVWVFDLEKDPHALSRAQQMDLRVVFSGAGLSLSEFPAR